MRRPYIAANWKMNLDRAAVEAFCAEARAAFAPGGRLSEGGPRVGVFPPSVYLPLAVEQLAGTGIVVGAQSCRPEDGGAFTGEISARMVADVGADAVIVGHSERRRIFGETDGDARARLDAALALGLDVILCVGETIEERRAGRTLQVVGRQIEAGCAGLAGPLLAERVTVAYEPVWAIGTGLTATPAQAQEVHAALRGLLGGLAGRPAAERVVIQYGGSVKPDNAAELMACPDVDGALVGGASLTMESFEAIVRFDRQGVDR